MDQSSSSIHQQPCYTVSACPSLESPAIYFSWKDTSRVLNGTAASPVEGLTQDSANVSSQQVSSESGQTYQRYGNIFQAIESMIGATEYTKLIEQEAERIRNQKLQALLSNPPPKHAARIESDNKFMENMMLLRRYVEENHGCLPPMSRTDYSLIGHQPTSKLHRFMMQMRQEVRKYHSDNPCTSSLTMEQYDELVSIGFVHELHRLDSYPSPAKKKKKKHSRQLFASSTDFGTKAPPSSSWTPTNLQKWNEMLARVQSFHKEHKRLPSHQDDENLYRWIQKQKQRVLESIANDKKKGKDPSNDHGHEASNSGAYTNGGTTVQQASPIAKRPPPQLSTEQVVKLATVGVSFTPPAQKVQIEARCQEWIAYRQEHGENPPSKSRLGIWASGIIAKYRNWKLGKQKRCNLTPTLLDQLTKAGFVFPTDQEMEVFRKQQLEQEQKPKHTWDDMFGMLQKWKQDHGHLSVPRNEPKLGNWTHTQRKQYNRLRRGEKSTMNPDRLKKLLSIGFTFSNTNWRKDRGVLVMDDNGDGGGPKHGTHAGFGMRPV